MFEILSRADLRADGFTSREITAAVRAGYLVRGRRDHYVAPDTPDPVIRAVRVGGRLTCVSLLALLGVFVFHVDLLHVHVRVISSRLRSPHDRRRALEPRGVRGVRLHWTPLTERCAQQATVPLIDALAHAVRCQAPRFAIATLDSALHLGLIGMLELDDVFELLPLRYGILRGLIDSRAESGPETLVRLMLRSLGVTARPQVQIDGVGRVDFLVDGWLVIECDSRAHHDGWERQEHDRRRDALLAARGYTSLRLTARVILHEPDLALAALRGILATR